MRGEPHWTGEKVLYDPLIWKVVFDDHGVMAYQLGNRASGNQFRWYDRNGTELGILGEPHFEFEPSLSPDGKKLAVGMADGGYSRLWVYDLILGSRKQVTFNKYDNGSPVWSPDGKHIFFPGSENTTASIRSTHMERDRSSFFWIQERIPGHST